MTKSFIEVSRCRRIVENHFRSNTFRSSLLSLNRVRRFCNYFPYSGAPNTYKHRFRPSEFTRVCTSDTRLEVSVMYTSGETRREKENIKRRRNGLDSVSALENHGTDVSGSGSLVCGDTRGSRSRSRAFTIRAFRGASTRAPVHSPLRAVRSWNSPRRCKS